MSSVFNPPTPYVGGIPGGVHDGTHILITGKPVHHDNMFTVNLQCGPSMNPRADTALHFNVRFSEHCVVRNSLQHGSWGSEERHGGLPFHKGQPFELKLVIKHNHIKMVVNGNHFGDFHHRINKHQINTLTIEGGIHITTVQFGGSGGMPAPPPPSMPQPGYPPAGAVYPPQGGGVAPGQPMYNPPVPLTLPIPGNVHPNRMICVSGIPLPNCQRFTINLQCGQYDGSDIALHFDVRMNYPGDTNQVIRNSMMGGGWGSEERGVPYFPFMPNANFDIMILAEHGKFKIAVNNQHFAEFHHRLRPLNRIDTLNVTGDLRLTQVRFQ